MTALPTRATIAAAPAGTVYCYRRLLFVWPEPFAKRLVASEVDADKGEPHHGLFRGEVVLGARLAKARANEARKANAREAAIAAHDRATAP